MIRTALYKSTCKSIVLAGLLGAPLLAAPLPAAAFISVGISVGFAPPPLPVYAQPYAPGPGYIWTPGYWAWDGYGYYWVPGTWILPPQIGLLWTPGWWGWDTGYYRWHAGYWGPSVGFYGGINYGFGYFGVGYVGGRWHGNDFYYNRAVSNVNVTNVRNVYVDKTVINNYNGVAPATRVSYNGGRGGLTARPTQAQLAATQERRFDPTAAQVRQRDLAKNDPAQQFKANHGRPSVTATSRPGNFKPAQTIPNGAAAAAPQSPGKTPRTEAATSRSDGFVHAPRATQSRTTTAASPSAIKAPPRSETATSRNDGFVHAPHAARNPTTTASRSPTRTSGSTNMPQPSAGFTQAPRNHAAAPERSQPSDHMQPRESMPPTRAPQPRAMPQQGYAPPPAHNADRAPPQHAPPKNPPHPQAPANDHKDDHGH